MKSKFTILLTLRLMMGAGSAWAARKDANISSSTQGGSNVDVWNASTGYFKWKGSYDARIILNGLSGDLSSYKYLVVVTSGYTDKYRVDFKITDDGTTKQVSCDREGTFIIDMTSVSGVDRTKIEEIRINTNSASGSITIKKAFVIDETVETPSYDANGHFSVDLSEVQVSTTGGYSYDYATGTITGTSVTSGTVTYEFATPYNFSSAAYMCVTYTGEGGITQRMKFTNKDATSGSEIYSSRYVLNGTSSYTTVLNGLKKITWEKYTSGSSEGTMKITSIVFSTNSDNQITVENSAKEVDEFTFTGSKTANNIGSESATTDIWGNTSVNSGNYASLAGYKKIVISGGTPSATLRFIFNRGSENLTQVSTIDGTENVDFRITLDANGNGEFDFSALSNPTLTVVKYTQSNVPPKKITVHKSAYSAEKYISGTLNSAALQTLLNTSTVTSIDASALANATAIELATANPNCLIYAATGKVSNSQNVIVGSTCASFALTDGKPFKAPTAFTASAAPTYDRSFSASTTTTVCLPFALTSTEASSLGTFYELSSFDDGSTLRFTSVATPEANKAYLVVPTGTSLSLSETSKSIVATPASLGSSITNVEFIGTLESTEIPASDATNSYFAYNDGSFVKITTNAATLPAFRGYFKVLNSAITSGSSARSLKISFDDETTGIQTVHGEGGTVSGSEAYYNLSGQRVNKAGKGLYIKNGKKYIF